MSTNNLEQLKEKLKIIFPDSEVQVSYHQLSFVIKSKEILSSVKVLMENDDFNLEQLIDITAVDFPNRSKRFEIIYHFLSLKNNLRIRLKSQINEDEQVESLVNLFVCANWFEREVFDMYGIVFSKHPDLRRILTDYEFQGFPLRKDFPLTGHVEVRYDEDKKKVVYDKVNLTQEYRNFDFMSPWEGANLTIPAQNKLDKEKDKDE
jgi:NADH-quinone oxidoreductase subunit C|tara:strand:- start:428 stop:1045 length:618 start_codon:yes stop_codon:yes gene_type:complete